MASSIGGLQMVSEAPRTPQGVSFRDIELHGERRPLQLSEDSSCEGPPAMPRCSCDRAPPKDHAKAAAARHRFLAAGDQLPHRSLLTAFAPSGCRSVWDGEWADSESNREPTD